MIASFPVFFFFFNKAIPFIQRGGGWRQEVDVETTQKKES